MSRRTPQTDQSVFGFLIIFFPLKHVSLRDFQTLIIVFEHGIKQTITLILPLACHRSTKLKSEKRKQYYHRRTLLGSFRLNGHTLRFQTHTEMLDWPHCRGQYTEPRKVLQRSIHFTVSYNSFLWCCILWYFSF